MKVNEGRETVYQHSLIPFISVPADTFRVPNLIILSINLALPRGHRTTSRILDSVNDVIGS